MHYNIPWSEIIRDFPLLLTGRAESWYWLFQKTNRFHDCEGLKYSLLSQYQSSKSNFGIITELAQRKQQHNESINTYFHIMGQIRAKLVQPISGNVQIQSGPSSFINAVILALRLRNAINPLMLRNLKFINYEKKKIKRRERK